MAELQQPQPAASLASAFSSRFFLNPVSGFKRSARQASSASDTAPTQKRPRLAYETAPSTLLIQGGPLIQGPLTPEPITPLLDMDMDMDDTNSMIMVGVDGQTTTKMLRTGTKDHHHSHHHPFPTAAYSYTPPSSPSFVRGHGHEEDDIPPTGDIPNDSYFPKLSFAPNATILPPPTTTTSLLPSTPPTTPPPTKPQAATPLPSQTLSRELLSRPAPVSPESLLASIPKPLTAEFLKTECRSLSHLPGHASWIYQDSIFIKYGPRVHESEALSMLTLSGSGVPVPVLYDCYRHPETGHWCILMQYVRKCQTLEQAHESGHLDTGLLDRITTQLAEIVSTLRDVRKASGIGSLATIATDATVGGGDGNRDWNHPPPTRDDLGPVHDHFFSASHILHGPFLGPLACQDFVDDLADAVQDRVMYEHQMDVVRDLTSISQPSLQVENDTNSGSGSGNNNNNSSSNMEFVLTHGELVPRHILVDSTGVRCIVDWSHAGFFPDYWEYTKAQFSEEPNCLLEEVQLDIPSSSSSPSQRGHSQGQQPQRLSKRLDLIFRPDRLAVNKAAILLMAKDIIY